MKLTRRGVIGLAVAAAVAIGGGAAFAASDSPSALTPNGTSISAVEAYTDSISNVTALFGTAPGAQAIGSDIQMPTGAVIQFAAVSSLSTVNAFTWNLAGAPAGYSVGITSGALALRSTQPTSTDTFKLDIAEVSPGLARAVVTVTVTPGVDSGHLSVSTSIDDVTLGAPVNSGGQVSFPEPSGVTETLTFLPAGVVFANDVLSSGTAVPGDYKSLVVQAKDASGSLATEGFDAIVRYTYPAVPRLSQGSAVFVTGARENVFFVQSGAPSWDHFTIVGPGAINGHQGWVNGHLGLNEAVYGGLEYKHGYTVYYQPVTGPGSSTPVPGSHYGYVYFVS